MLILSYDISNDKLRTQFSKYIKKYGRRLQYSVYEIKHSQRILDNVMLEIKSNFEKRFTNNDSVFIFDMHNRKVHRYGYAKNEESDLLFFEWFLSIIAHLRLPCSWLHLITNSWVHILCFLRFSIVSLAFPAQNGSKKTSKFLLL